MSSYRFAFGCAAALCVAAAAAVPAGATYPGSDGAIAYIGTDTGRYEIHAVRPDGSGALDVSRMCAFPGSIGREPDWSPDGSMIAYNYNLLLYVQRTDGGRPSRLVDSGLNIEDGAAWSPDGSRIAFEGGAFGSFGMYDIYVVNRDGSGLTNLTNTPHFSESNPAWSPDGTRLVFTQRDEPTVAAPQSTSLFTMPAGGGEPTQLTFSRPDIVVQDDGADWSPDGSSIVFRRESDNQWAIYAVSATGGQPTAITQPGLPVDSPSWSPSGHRITFSGSIGETSDAVWMMNADGSGIQLVINPGIADATPDWGTAESYTGGPCGQPPSDLSDGGGGTGTPKLFGKPRAVRRGVAWKLGCIAHPPRRCNATVKLTGATSGDGGGRAAALLGKASKLIPAGQTRRVVARLNRAGRRALHAKRRLSIKATAVISYRQAGTTKRHTRRRTLPLRR